LTPYQAETVIWQAYQAEDHSCESIDLSSHFVNFLIYPLNYIVIVVCLFYFTVVFIIPVSLEYALFLLFLVRPNIEASLITTSVYIMFEE
jgi:hypothetical protein